MNLFFTKIIDGIEISFCKQFVEDDLGREVIVEKIHSLLDPGRDCPAIRVNQNGGEVIIDSESSEYDAGVTASLARGKPLSEAREYMREAIGEWDDEYEGFVPYGDAMRAIFRDKKTEIGISVVVHDGAFPEDILEYVQCVKKEVVL